MNKRNGIIFIILGASLILISLFFAEGYRPKLGFGNLQQMVIVIKEGNLVLNEGTIYSAGRWGTPFVDSHYEGRIILPLRYALSAGVLLIALGAIFFFASKEDKV